MNENRIADAIAVVSRLKSTALSVSSSCKGLMQQQQDFICSKMDTDQKSVVAQEITFNPLTPIVAIWQHTSSDTITLSKSAKTFRHFCGFSAKFTTF